MKIQNMPSLNIGNLIAKIPIIQGGMGVGISGSQLASAVANEGAIGVISAVGLGMTEPDFRSNFKEANKRVLKNEIRKARSLTNGILGVNLMVALSDYDELVECALEENIDILIMGAGLPIKFSKMMTRERFQHVKTKMVPIVSSARAARIIMNYWDKKYCRMPDAIIVEGPMAGGHLGFKLEQIEDPDFALEKLVPALVKSVAPFETKYQKSIPVIAAGGIFTGEDISLMLKLGAKAVQMGTRFVATHECDANIHFKEMYVNAKKEDLIIIKSPVGLPGRAIKNTFLKDVLAGVKKPFQCPWKCLRTCNIRESPYCIASALIQAKLGNFKDGFAFAGSNAWKIKKIISVKELIQTLKRQYNEVIETEINMETSLRMSMSVA